ncbi:MAG: helix-turn-helix domain-containing protein [Tindallia sp. MSAO_Bac2]|nr:MAG: helix-turn-helix domain-containing protein [Tindallia sp. MSAO_Bac2]
MRGIDCAARHSEICIEKGKKGIIQFKQYFEINGIRKGNSMVIQCGIIGNTYDDWLEELFARHEDAVFKVSRIELPNDQGDQGFFKHIEANYDLVIVGESHYFSMEPLLRKGISDHTVLIVSGVEGSFYQVRTAFLEGCFDYIIKTMPEDELKSFRYRLEEHFLQSERNLALLARRITEEMTAVYPRTEKLFLQYWSLLDIEKDGSDYQINDYANAIERLIRFLPLKPIRFHLEDLAQGAAEWICEADYSQERFIATLLFIQQAYRDIFLPHCRHPLVRQAVDLYLDEQFDVETVQDIADHLYVNRSYLSKTFITESDTDLTRYMMRTKMYAARLLLLDSRLSVYDVMEYLRYTDYGHFRKTFKKYTGITPSEYVVTYRDRFSIEVIEK